MDSRIPLGLYKDKQGRRCWLVACTPGQRVCFFVEGRRPYYVQYPWDGYRKLFKRYKPKQGSEAPEWFLKYRHGRTRSGVVCQRHGQGWDGLYPVEIKGRLYFMTGNMIAKHFFDAADGRRMTRVAFQPDYV